MAVSDVAPPVIPPSACMSWATAALPTIRCKAASWPTLTGRLGRDPPRTVTGGAGRAKLAFCACPGAWSLVTGASSGLFATLTTLLGSSAGIATLSGYCAPSGGTRGRDKPSKRVSEARSELVSELPIAQLAELFRLSGHKLVDDGCTTGALVGGQDTDGRCVVTI
jgi:hypothetical protein